MILNRSLPYDAEVEYLRSSDGSYIDTGIKVSGNLVLKTMLYSYFSSDKFGLWCFGGRNVLKNKAFGIYINSNTQKVIFVYNDTSVDLDLYSVYPQVAQIEIGNGRINIGNYQHTYKTKAFTGDNNLYLFGLNNGGRRTSGNNIDIGATYVTNGVTTIDLIPVRKGGVGYMYDKVSGQLFGNAGSGDFILGPDINRGGE